ncbi:MAG TPA: hypothetical protein VK762_33130, partial [Polyangiaceae bacterium]|nr:hypothetical protein [Polyangiaceae bacterium]
MRRILTNMPSRGVWVSALATVIGLTGASAHAQTHKKKPAVPAAAAQPAQPAPVDMDADSAAPAPADTPAAAPAGKKKPAKVVDNSPPATAGQPTEAAAQAKRLYDREKWWDAAKALYRVSTGETGDDEGNKQIAQFNLAKALYKLKFYQGAYSIFSEIADRPNHLKYNETLLWLAKLATDLPEPADIIERVGKYNEEHVAKFNNKEQQEIYWQLNYLLGRYRYRNGQFPEGLALLDKVDRRSKYYVQAQFFGGVTNVQMRQSKPAVEAFQRILGAIEEGDVEVEDEARMRDLAYLSMARTFYSASVTVDETTNA